MSTLIVNTHQAKSRLSELIREAEAGAEVIVARNGRPVARIVPWDSTAPERIPGSWRGRVEIHDDIVAPDPDTAALFDGEAGPPA